MDILQSLQELNDLVDSAKRFPLTDKLLVPEDELIHLIDNIRREWPSALSEAQEIIEKRDQILAEAQAKAKDIEEKAISYAKVLVSKEQIMLSAKDEAAVVLQKAQTEVSQAQATAQQIVTQSTQYSQQVFEHSATQLAKCIEALQKAQSAVNTAKNSVANYSINATADTSESAENNPSGQE